MRHAVMRIVQERNSCGLFTGVELRGLSVHVIYFYFSKTKELQNMGRHPEGPVEPRADDQQGPLVNLLPADRSQPEGPARPRHRPDVRTGPQEVHRDRS